MVTWECLSSDRKERVGGTLEITTERLSVWGGWIVRTILTDFENAPSVTQTFVGDINHYWKLP